MAAPTAASSGSSATLECRNPATLEVIGTVPIDSRKTVEAKVERARKAAHLWGQLSFAQRREELSRWRREIASRLDDFVDIIHRENGKARLEAMKEVAVALGHLDHAARHAHSALAPKRVGAGILKNFRATISYHPLGVIGV